MLFQFLMGLSNRMVRPFCPTTRVQSNSLTYPQHGLHGVLQVAVASSPSCHRGHGHPSVLSGRSAMAARLGRWLGELAALRSDQIKPGHGSPPTGCIFSCRLRGDLDPVEKLHGSFCRKTPPDGMRMGSIALQCIVVYAGHFEGIPAWGSLAGIIPMRTNFKQDIYAPGRTHRRPILTSGESMLTESAGKRCFCVHSVSLVLRSASVSTSTDRRQRLRTKGALESWSSARSIVQWQGLPVLPKRSESGVSVSSRGACRCDPIDQIDPRRSQSHGILKPKTSFCDVCEAAVFPATRDLLSSERRSVATADHVLCSSLKWRARCGWCLCPLALAPSKTSELGGRALDPSSHATNWPWTTLWAIPMGLPRQGFLECLLFRFCEYASLSASSTVSLGYLVSIISIRTHLRRRTRRNIAIELSRHPRSSTPGWHRTRIAIHGSSRNL